jgi:hypothetical protein
MRNRVAKFTSTINASQHRVTPTAHAGGAQVASFPSPALGVRSDVACPTSLDEGHGRVNKDRTDALGLATRPDGFVAGSDKGLAIVRVPPVGNMPVRDSESCL